MLKNSILLGLLILLSFGACKKNKIFSGATQLGFSTDTLTFDTVFTTRGSTTKYFKVFNKQKQKINIDRIYIKNGAATNFKINVDGVAGSNFTNVEIPAQDSIYIFVSVTVDPNNQNTPIIIEDAVMFENGGNTQELPLTAWGQDAYYHHNELISNTTWKSDKPHVIVSVCLVDTACTLTIEKGTKIFSHKNSILLVSGKINAIGTKQDSIVFQADRLESYFRDLPGQWYGIMFLRGSLPSTFEHVIIKNAVAGISIGNVLGIDIKPADITSSNSCQVTLNKCIIKNCEETAVRSFYSNYIMNNCLFYNCSQNVVLLAFGGNHIINNCTFANYNSATIDHGYPVFRLTNFVGIVNSLGTTVYYKRSTHLTINNSIIFGNIEKGEEIALDEEADTSAFEYNFSHCILSTSASLTSAHYTACHSSSTDINYPGFTDYANGNFTLNSASIGLDNGVTLTNITDDINDKSRDATPDIGCFEH